MTYIAHVRPTRSSNRGIGLVELMVGMVIALAAMIVIMQVFAQSEGQKRSTNYGADAQTNGAVALYTIERDARLAGFGLSSASLLNCPAITIWRQSTLVAQQLRFAPFEVNPPAASVLPGDANTDVVAIAFGVSDTTVEGVGASQTPNAGANIVVANRSGFNTGDLVVGVQSAGVLQCTLHEITNVPGGQCGDPPSGAATELVHGTGNYKNYGKGCLPFTAEYNRAGGIPGVASLVKPIGGGVNLFNLGAMPVNLAYAIRSNNLTVCDRVLTDCTQAANFIEIASDIVSLRAVYGKDTTVPPDGTVDVWDRVTPATDTQWLQVAAARIEIVARSAIKERADAAGSCNHLTPNRGMPDNQTWLGQGVAGAEIDISGTDPEWQCYRYKLFQTVVPFRNLIWRP